MVRKVLFVIDVQTHFITGEDPLPEAQQVVSTIRKLVDKARETASKSESLLLSLFLSEERAPSNHFPVIWVRHDSDKEALFFPNTPPWEIAAGLAPPTDVDGDEPIVAKTQRDAFTAPRFGQLLDAEIEKYKDEGLEFFFTGVQSEKCVQVTCASAMERYKNEPAVKRYAVVEDGHATYSIGEKSYRTVSEDVNSALAALGAEVVKSDNVF
jgi:nicotinamidase-related amidase